MNSLTIILKCSRISQNCRKLSSATLLAVRHTRGMIPKNTFQFIKKGDELTNPLETAYLEKPDTKPTYTNPRDVDVLPSEKRSRKLVNLLLTIKTASFVKSLLTVYIKERQDISWVHQVAMLERFSFFVKNGAISSSELHANATFQSLMYDIFKALRLYEANHVIDILKYLIDLEVPDRSAIVLSTLQVMRHQINIYIIDDVVKLAPLLHRLCESPLQKALVKALPHILQNCLLDPINPSLTTKELLQLVEMCLPKHTKGGSRMLSHLHSHHLPKILHTRIPGWQREVSQIFTMLTNVPKKMWKFYEDDYCHLELDGDDLVHQCSNALVEADLSELSQGDVLGMVIRFVAALKKGRRYVLNEEVILSLAKYALTQDWDAHVYSSLVHNLHLLGIVLDDLTTLTVSKVLAEENFTENSLEATSILSAIAMSDFDKEEAQSKGKEFFNKCFTFNNEEYMKIPWLKFCIDLVYLNINIEDILHASFLEEYLTLPAQDNKYSVLNLLHISLSSNPNFNSNSIIPYLELQKGKKMEEEKKVVKAEKWRLHQCLISLPITYSFFIRDVISRHGIFIDYLLLLDENGRIVRADSAVEHESISYLSIPSTFKKMALILISEYCVYGPSQIYDSQCKITDAVLRKEGIIFIPIIDTFMSDESTGEAVTYLRTTLLAAGINLKDM